MRLGQAILDALGDRTQTWLAGEVGLDAGQLSRILNDKVKDVPISFVVAVEDALDLNRGDILRAAGYVDEAVTLKAAVASDPDLTSAQKQTLRALIRSWTE